MIKALLLLPLLIIIGLSNPMPAHATDLFSGACGTKKAQDESAVCNSKTSTDPISGSDGALAKITNIVAYIAGGAAVIMLIYGSIKYVTSGGDSGNVKSAKDTVFFALIGVAVIVIARFLILFVLSKL